MSETKIRADFSQRVVVRPKDYIWESSPTQGVLRVKFDRIGDEIARATSLVRYTPNSEFPAHQHFGGEEILVLEGVFEDGTGQYPTGTYLRNPIGSEHQPKAGPDGALLFVKLGQFSTADIQTSRISTFEQSWSQGLVPGLTVLPLHEHATEHTALVNWLPNTQFQRHTHIGGEEIFVIRGTFYDEHGSYESGSWIRSPHMSTHTPYTKEDGALIYVKTGHLNS